MAPDDAGLVQVSVPHGRHLESSGFVVVHQTRRPLGDLVVAGLPTTSAARAAVDLSVRATRRRDVDHVVSDVLQRGLADLEELAAEARFLGPHARPWLREALLDASRGMRSVGEGDLRRVVQTAGLPEPVWNAEIRTAAGRYLLDAYWEDRKLGAEADGAAFHLSAQAWDADLRRQNAVQSTGIRLLRFPVRRLRREPASCATELRRAFEGRVE